MKKLFTIIFALLLASNTFAQSLEILQPLQMIENSSVLVQYKNLFGKHEMPDKDVPFPFALIRVRLEGSGTEVTAAQQVLGLQMGTQIVVADMDRSQTNEILFLVPITAKNIYVTCGNGCKEQLLVSSARLRPNTVYTCKVHYTPEEIVYGPQKPKITSQYLLINVTPSNAIVEVDGNLWTTNNGVAGNLLDFGEHSYRVSAPDYASAEGEVVVNDPENTQSLTVALKPRFCSVTLKVENNAEIWVNGAKKGAGQWTGNLGYGPYRIETRLQGHVDGMVQQTISENDANRTITLPAPTPIYGSLRVETQPFQADIYLDGKNVGKTPKMFSEVIIGSHKVEVKMAGYEGLSTTQTITEGQMAVVGGALTEKPKETAAELATIGENHYFGKNGYTKDYAKAIEYSRKAAEQGSASGQFRLGYCYAYGQGVNHDYSQAVYWFQKAAEQGYADAQTQLGVCYHNGYGVKQDYSQAVYWHRKAAEQGIATAQYNLGVCYERGYGVNQDYSQAVYWFQKTAEQGYAMAQYALGLCYYNGQGVNQDYSQAAHWFRKAAEQGYAMAQYNLGVCYKNGQGVTQDYSQAMYWYRKAAEQEYAMAQYNLGVCYYNGQGVQRDYFQAVYWHRKAAEQGNTDAQNYLGVCYENGRGVTQDYSQAVYWYRKAAEQGLASAQYNLGICYKIGQGVTQDYSQAVYWYRKAAEQGLAEAQYNLGICYKIGQGVTQDYSQAVYWYRKAAEQGYATAQNNLGVCYENGQGIGQDYAQAVYWYRKAAEQGLAEAQYNLGVCYYNGQGVDVDKITAKKYFQQAADQKYQNAIDVMRKNY